MNQSKMPLFSGDHYAPSSTDEFLWWLATAEKELLKECVVDRNRYRIIGLMVLSTWLFATLAWIYFFSTVTDQALVYTGCGLFMGFVILSIDRALIKGITRFNKRKAAPLLFRGILALTIGTFMAQPALLYLFNKEVQLQVSVDNEKRKLAKRNELESLYKSRKEALQQEKATLQNELTLRLATVNAARDRFLAEADGSGGTGKIGLRDIALAKRNEYLKLDQEYQALATTHQERIALINKDLRQMEQTIQEQETLFLNYLNTGFLTRIEALQHLLENNRALQFRYYLLLILLLLIELMPVIAKSLLPSGSYEEKVQHREAMEKLLAAETAVHEKEMKRLYNKLVVQQTTQTMEEFFKLQKDEQSSKLGHWGKQWKENEENVQGFWEKIKIQMISNPEN